MDNLSTGTIIAIAAPFILLQIGLDVVALLDLARRHPSQVRHLPKWGWAAVILLVNFLGAIAYLVAGREES